MICTIYAPWFGALPFYSNTFLHCCGLSKDIYWVIHSDQLKPNNCPDNVIWTVVNNSYIQTQLSKIFPNNVPNRDNWGHKLCDIKTYWHIIFDVNIPTTKFRGWCDWDIVHNLSTLSWEFTSAKFTNGSMRAPLYIQLNTDLLLVDPIHVDKMLAQQRTVSWSELYYMQHLPFSHTFQHGMTPEIDLHYPVPYVVHMYKGKGYPDLYKQWAYKYLIGWDRFGCDV